MKIIMFLAGWLGISYSALAQLTYGAGIGTTGYSGDVNDVSIGSARYSINGDVGYKVNDMLELYGSATFYEISAKDAVPQRNINFRSRNLEAYVGARFFLTSPYKTFVTYKTDVLLPYFYGGVGVTTIDPYARDGKGEYVSMRQLRLEGRPVPSSAAIYPIGFGLRLRLTQAFYINAEGGLRFVNSDMLDGIMTDKVKSKDISPEARSFIASLGQTQSNLVNAMNSTDATGGFVYKNGNPARKDLYGIFQLRVEFIPAASAKQSEFKYRGRSASSIYHRRKPSRRLK
ncbi:MAG: porin family protein [Cytophagales bacterium]|nr:porin family protein [Cytophagales bacterium]MDW8384694.1 outer membrane beta-barrel protein [Flammeovirgaceae bacterium]